MLVSKQVERRASVTKELRERKVPVYEDLIRLIFRITYAEKKGEQPLTEKELMESMIKLTQDLVIWGSDGVIDAFYKFRTLGVETKGSPSFEIMFRVEDLLFAIRRDLGHRNKGMRQGKILGLFVNDIQNYLRKP